MLAKLKGPGGRDPAPVPAYGSQLPWLRRFLPRTHLKEASMSTKFGPALIMAVLLVAGWCHPAAAYTLKVKAWIDGWSQLIIQGNTVQWHNVTYNAPGYESPYGDPPAPTYLTTKHLKTVAWTPGTWSSGTSGNTDSDHFTGLSAPLAAVDETVTLTVKHARGPVTIYQQPSAAGVYRLIVDFNDESSEGASWYEVSLEYTPGVPLQLLGVLEGMTNSMAYALNAKGQATGASRDERESFFPGLCLGPQGQGHAGPGDPGGVDSQRGRGH